MRLPAPDRNQATRAAAGGCRRVREARTGPTRARCPPACCLTQALRSKDRARVTARGPPQHRIEPSETRFTPGGYQTARSCQSLARPAGMLGRASSQRRTTIAQSSVGLSGGSPNATAAPATTDGTLPFFRGPPRRGSNHLTVKRPAAWPRSRLVVPPAGK